ncbi:MAG: hypothetical protein OWQ48_00885 [Desulfurococcus sp.]|nr:hypothetical protein [Desulfurococcus sp.]
MAIRYRCRNCGAILYEFVRVGQNFYGIPTPEEVYRLYGGVCPKCKSLLEVPSLEEIRSRIVIRSAISYKYTIPKAAFSEVSPLRQHS